MHFFNINDLKKKKLQVMHEMGANALPHLFLYIYIFKLLTNALRVFVKNTKNCQIERFF